jgi:hypothetical protein
MVSIINKRIIVLIGFFLILVSINIMNVKSWPINKYDGDDDERLNQQQQQHLAELIAENGDDDWLFDDDLLNRIKQQQQHQASKRSRQRFGETRTRVKELNNQPFGYDPQQQADKSRLKNVYEKLKVSSHLHH